MLLCVGVLRMGSSSTGHNATLLDCCGVALAQYCGAEHLTCRACLSVKTQVRQLAAVPELKAERITLCVLTVAPSTAGGCCSSQLC